jgi:manganese transport protein
MAPPPPFEAATAAAAVPPTPSLPEVHRSVRVPLTFWRKLGAFMGPGYLVAVGYMDPGNWATDIAGGSAFGYQLLSVILLSNIMAMVLQSLSAKLGIVQGLDLAQACRAHYSRPVSFALWVLCELAIIACDLAEVIGTAIALQLAMAQPSIAAIAAGLVPSSQIVTNPAMLYIAIGILGATVMPHNLYLHSSIVQTRAFDRSEGGKAEAIKLATLDSSVALFLALFINASILIIAAAAFHTTGRTEVAEIGEAHALLAPVLGVGAASTLFAIALLASGQNSTVTGTLAGQIVMEGFLDLRLPMWLRRMITRLVAIVPAAVVAALYGESGTAKLLVLSQVILSLQLPFAMVPLVSFTSDPKKMGRFANRGWLKAAAFLICAVVITLNVTLLWNTFS